MGSCPPECAPLPGTSQTHVLLAPGFRLLAPKLITGPLITDYFEPPLSAPESPFASRLGLELGRHWPRSPVLVNGNECKGTFCDPASGIACSASAPRLNSDGHLCASDPR